MKALFHVNELDRWAHALLNITNLLRDVGTGEVTVEVVANGPAVIAYRLGSDDALRQMDELHAKGVAFVACRNALQMQNIPEESLAPFVTVVPAGITEIVRKQAMGYAYIKP
ncbi:DsrE family protein [Desulforudis sp. 1088]|uniref:DsrE family protein n=1 Tax=unclassified Candidatus Desulforudis TaxID=2635950 RepID=UPI0034697EB3